MIHPPGKLKLKRLIISSVRENLKPQEPLYITGGRINCYNCFGKIFDSPIEVEYTQAL